MRPNYLLTGHKLCSRYLRFLAQVWAEEAVEGPAGAALHPPRASHFGQTLPRPLPGLGNQEKVARIPSAQISFSFSHFWELQGGLLGLQEEFLRAGL